MFEKLQAMKRRKKILILACGKFLLSHSFHILYVLMKQGTVGENMFAAKTYFILWQVLPSITVRFEAYKYFPNKEENIIFHSWKFKQEFLALLSWADANFCLHALLPVFSLCNYFTSQTSGLVNTCFFGRLSKGFLT